MTGEQNTSDLAILMGDRQVDRLFQNRPGELHFQLRDQTGFRSLPSREQLTSGIQHLSVCHFFGRCDHCQRLSGGSLVVEHDRRFHGVADRPGDQMQVVVGINPQRQNAQQGQRNTGHRHCHQCDREVPTAENRA